MPRESYRWAVEIEIEFVEPRLGVSLREVVGDAKQVDGNDTNSSAKSSPRESGAPFFAEVDALPKPQRGKRAGAAELYNWSVPVHRRLTVGMRLTGINDAHLAGWSYLQVVQALKHAGRPARLRFADVSKGTLPCDEHDEDEQVGDDSDRRSDGTATSGDDQQQELLQQDRTQLGGQQLTQLYRLRVDELARELVTRELHVERWRLAQRQAERARAMAAAKSLVLSHAVDALMDDQRELRAAKETLARDQRRLERVLSDLKAQAEPGAVRPEVERAQRLEERQALLLRDIDRLEAGNERLKRERGARRRSLEDMERELVRVEMEKQDSSGNSKAGRRGLRLPSKQLDGEDDDEDEDEQGEDDGSEWLGDDVAGLSPTETLAALRLKTRAVEEELAKEQRKMAKARHERGQLRKLDEELTALGNGERML